MRLTPLIFDFTSVFVQRRSVETAPFFLEHFVILGIADMLFSAGYVVYQTRVEACFIQCLNTVK